MRTRAHRSEDRANIIWRHKPEGEDKTQDVDVIGLARPVVSKRSPEGRRGDSYREGIVTFIHYFMGHWDAERREG